MRAFVFCMIGAAALSSVAEEFSAWALVDYPSLKERFRTKSSLENGLGEMLCGKDDANGLFYTYEPDGHMTVTRFRCYDYKRGLLWSRDLPKFAFKPIWCAGKYVYVGDEKDGTVRCYDLDDLRREPRVIVRPETGNVGCVEVAGYGEGRVDLDLDRECLSNAVSENCFCIRVERGFWECFFSRYPYRNRRYELVEIRDGVQCRKKLPFPLEYGGLERWDRDACISGISLWE